MYLSEHDLEKGLESAELSDGPPEDERLPPILVCVVRAELSTSRDLSENNSYCSFMIFQKFANKIQRRNRNAASPFYND